jgi:hypothetical protein
MTLRVRATSLHVLNLRTRMPFRYGIATVTALPHLFVRLDLEVDDQVQVGVSADHLPPKWFTKDPHTSYEQDLTEMIAVIESACGLALEVTADSPFDLWKQIYAQQEQWASTRQNCPPLLWNFGVTLVERAVIDAFCRATSQSFPLVARTNGLGIRLGEIHPQLAHAIPADFLPREPLQSIVVRHTIGLSDPLTDADIAPAEKLDDGLPQSLESVIAAYGVNHFKIKLGGDPDRDLARVRAITSVIRDRELKLVTLDGNENYRDIDALKSFWNSFAADAHLKPLLRKLQFMEQPLHRDIALADSTAAALHAWPDRPPMIIDESDGALDSARRALAAGYIGTSFKSCKGIIKGVATACLMRYLGGVISAEDLSTVGPISLLQDLAVIATLGIPHAERNGHHYFRGALALPEDVREELLVAHGDLYQDIGFPALRIERGRIDIPSLLHAPFGTNFVLDPSIFIPLQSWNPASLSS